MPELEPDVAALINRMVMRRKETMAVQVRDDRERITTEMTARGTSESGGFVTTVAQAYGEAFSTFVDGSIEDALTVARRKYVSLSPDVISALRSTLEDYFVQMAHADVGSGGRLREELDETVRRVLVERLAIAKRDLGIHFDLVSLEATPPAAMPDPEAGAPPRRLRAFVSYSTENKLVAGEVKRALSAYGIDCFLAHDDIHVSEEWRERILGELASCQIFIALLSEAFKRSEWAPQEIGVVVRRSEVAIVPLCLDETIPFGFVAKIQGIRVPQRDVDPAAILEPLASRFPRFIIPGMIARVRDAASFRGAEAAFRPLVKHFASLTQAELDALVSASIKNGEVWSASQCSAEYLPELIRVNRARIDPVALKALEYQIANNERYRPEVSQG